MHEGSTELERCRMTVGVTCGMAMTLAPSLQQVQVLSAAAKHKVLLEA